jgi:hypothetical protein
MAGKGSTYNLLMSMREEEEELHERETDLHLLSQMAA